MAMNKVNSRLRFFYRHNKFLNILFRHYACNAWYPNLNKNLKTRLRAAQKKCIRFYLKIDDRKSITVKELEKIN